MRNPGFEGEIYQSTVQCGSGTTSSCTDSNLWSAWPVGFWQGATFEFIHGAASGLTGTVSGYTAANSGASGGVFTFSGSIATAPAAGDYMIVRQKFPGNATAGWWTSTYGSGTITTNSTDLPAGTAGVQTISLSAPGAADSASIASYFDQPNRSFVQLNGTFQVAFQAKGTGGSNAIAVSVGRVGGATYLSQTVSLTNSWQTYTLNFSATEAGSAIGNVQLNFGTVGSDSFYMDNVSLTQTNSSSSNPTVFRDAVVNTLKSVNPGVLRFWSGGQLGDTLDNLVAGQFGRQRSGYSAWSTEQDDIEYGLYDFLQLCQQIGADPWFVVPITFSTTDAANLIEYLASPSSTKYGAIRAAQGQVAPWTSVFGRIHLEFGNEAWNSTGRGGDIEDPVTYGYRAQTIFAAMRADGYYSAPSFDLILGGQAVNPWVNQTIQNNCNNNDSFTIATYMMSTVNTFDTNEDLFGSTFAEPQAFVSAAGTGEGVNSGWFNVNGAGQTVGGGFIALNKLAIQNSSHPVPLVVYETNLTTTQGAITQAALNSYATSVGAGIAVAENMMIGMANGLAIENMWSLPQYNFAISTAGGASSVNLWGGVIDMGGQTNLQRPQLQALTMANQAIPPGSNMLQITQSGANPTWNQGLINGVQLNGAQYIESFAFSNATQSGAVIFNLHRSSALPVTFSGSNMPTGPVQMTTLTSANITDTNEAGSVVAPVTQLLSNFNPATGLTLPPFSMTVLTWGVQPLISNVSISGVTTSGATLSWTTSVPSTSQVVYGTSTSYGLTAGTATLTTSHSVVLSGLSPATAYDVEIKSADASGNPITSSNYTLTTLVALPVISAVQSASITTSTALITWTTTTPSTSQVAYGTTAAYGSSATSPSAFVTSHSVSLFGLAASTAYDYEVKSTDASGNSVTSGNFTFTTAAAAVPKPVISGVAVSGITTSGATVTWTTSTPTTTTVAYGTSSSLVQTTATNSALTTSHSAAITGLTAGKTYYYQVSSTDGSGNNVTSTVATFATSAPSGTTLAISNVQSSVSGQGAVITWTTNLSATGQVVYGSSTSYGFWSNVLSAGTSQTMTLPWIPTGTVHFEIVAVSGNQTVTSQDYTIQNSPVGPVVSSVTATAAASSSTAVVSWLTNVAASGQVEFGSTTNYGLWAASATSGTSQAVTLPWVPAGTVHYRIHATGANGIATISPDYQFTMP